MRQFGGTGLAIGFDTPAVARDNAAMPANKSAIRLAMRVIMALFYFAAGVVHLRSPGGFLQITPQWVPFPEAVIFLTGLCEIAGAIALLFIPGLRAAAGVGLAAYAVCVYPANINHALNDIAVNGTHLSWWYHGPRLAFQPVLVWWALWVGNVIEWPFGRKSAA